MAKKPKRPLIKPEALIPLQEASDRLGNQTSFMRVVMCLCEYLPIGFETQLKAFVVRKFTILSSGNLLYCPSLCLSRK